MGGKRVKKAVARNGGHDMMYWVLLGTGFTYLVMLMFCAKTVLAKDPQDLDVWLNALVDAVCISTFTYVFTQTINNLVSGGSGVLKVCMLSICLCVLYILLYSLFELRPFWLNLVLCIYTIVLIILTFISVHLTVKAMEDGEYVESGEFNPNQLIPLESRLPE